MTPISPGVYCASVPLTPGGLLYRVLVDTGAGRLTQWPDWRSETPYRTLAPWRPAWVTHGSVALQEGAPVFRPALGETVFADVPDAITALPDGLGDLVGLRYPRAFLLRAQDQSFGGHPIPFRVVKPTRLFLGVTGTPPTGFGRWASRALVAGGTTCNIVARDYPPGEYTLVFARPPLPAILGFRELAPGDRPLDVPTLQIAGRKVFETITQDYVTTTGDAEFYAPQPGARVYLDRAYAIQRVPEELRGCVGLRFPNETAKAGELALPFRLTRPATLYVVFGNPSEGAWQKPLPGWRLYAKDAYQHGPGDEVLRSIYCREYPAGEDCLALPNGTAVVLGFR
jgi:hypothetical protein